MGKYGLLGCFIPLIFFLIGFAGWVEHLIICFTAGKWGFLIAGAICFPVAVVHGWGHWFGWW